MTVSRTPDLEDTPRLDGVRIKIARAFDLLQDLTKRTDQYRVIPASSIRRIDRGHKAEFSVAEVPRPDPMWSAVAGDILQNLNAALDHLAWQLVWKDGKQPKKGSTKFPVKEGEELSPKIDDKGLTDKVDEAKKKADTTLSPMLTLCGLRAMANVDKHRLLLTQCLARDKQNIVFWGSNDEAPRPSVWISGTPLEEGAVFARFDFDGAPIQASFQPTFEFDWYFRKVEEVEFTPVVATLGRLGRLVVETVNLFVEDFDDEEFHWRNGARLDGNDLVRHFEPERYPPTPRPIEPPTR